MALRLSNISILCNQHELSNLPSGKLLVNTINAHSFNTAQNDPLFAEALTNGDVLIPDGAPIVWACKFLRSKSQPRERIAGWDLFMYEMRRVEEESKELEKECEKDGYEFHPLKVLFMGSSEKVLALIKDRTKVEFPHLEVITYSPPFKPEFSREDNDATDIQTMDNLPSSHVFYNLQGIIISNGKKYINKK